MRSGQQGVPAGTGKENFHGGDSDEDLIGFIGKLKFSKGWRDSYESETEFQGV